MRRLVLIFGVVLLLTSCVSSRDVHFLGGEFTGATMEGFVPRVTATVNIVNDSHTTLKVSKIALQLLSSEGDVVANIVIPEEVKIKHGESALSVVAYVRFSDIETLMGLVSGNFEGGFEKFVEGLYIGGSARVRAGLMAKTMQIEPIKFTDLLDKFD